ncbi:mitotic spindle checkpoint protein MAD1-like isoform X1 [Miscanthus floridulus]|uniref:mitotic spindle checkpoint protein MAD1-like isoform X1 n=1 Tax=Miscanthus floridulus TaxID=154761 RepID=UPI003458BA39
MTENPGAKAASAQVWSRVALGNLTNVAAAGGRLGAPDAEKGVDEARKLKSCSRNVEWLKEKLLKEQEHRERGEVELPELKEIEAMGLTQSTSFWLQYGSCKVLLSNKPDVSPYNDLPQKQALTNLNEVAEATLTKDSAESSTGEVNWLEYLLAALSEERDKPMNHQPIVTKQETRNADDTSLMDMMSGVHGMGKTITALERIIDELISRQDNERSIFNERLSIERGKVQSLERERDQLRSQVALLQSKLGGDCSASNTKIPYVVNTLAVDSEAKPNLNKTENWLKTVEELKAQASGPKKQPVVLEICDDEDACIWCDDDEKPSPKSNALGSGEQGSEPSQLTGLYEWFFRGNKLMLSSGMKKYLRELCGCVPPEIPFYIYQMNKSNLKSRGKMRFSAKYISKPLLSCLHKGAGYTHFEFDGEYRGTVRVKLNPDGRASLTSGWENVVADKDIKVGDICAFHFKISDDSLKLSVYVFHPVRHLVLVR